VKQRNGLAAATLAHSHVIAIEGTSEEAVVVLHFEKEAHYKIVSNRLKDVEWALGVEFGQKCRVRLLPPSSPSLTLEQVKSAWDKVKKRAKQKNGLVAATLAHSHVIAIEGTAEVAVIVLHIEKEAHYKIISNRLKDVEWALGVEFGCECKVRLLPPGSSLDDSF